MTNRFVVFSDIDGTLIDSETYTLGTAETSAITAVADLNRRDIPLVLCSAKTSAEQNHYRHKLGITAPYIAENGSAVFMPPSYFSSDVPHGRVRAEDGYLVQEFGTAVSDIRAEIPAIQAETGLSWQGLNEFSPAEAAVRTGMSPTAVARAQQRGYSETILTPLGVNEIHVLREALAKRGLALLVRESYHLILSANSHEGTAVDYLMRRFRDLWGETPIETVGLGNSANDAHMLGAVHRPFLVQKTGGGWHNLPTGVAANLVSGIGPIGWQQVIASLLADQRVSESASR